MNKPILLFVIADSSQTGTPRQVFYLARVLGNDYTIHCACPAGPLVDKLEATAAVVHLLEGTSRKQLTQQLGKIYQQVRPSVIHCHGVRAGIIGRLALDGKRPIVVYTEHLWTGDFHLANPLRQLVQLRLLRWLNRRTDHTVAVSHAVLDFLLKAKITDQEHSSLIYGAIEPLPVATNSTSPIIGSLGRLTWVKGIELLVEALPALAEKIGNVSCHIAGEGPEKGRLVALANSLGMAGRIKWLMPEDEADFYREIQVYVQPSFSESFGMAPLLAMSAGIPTLVSSAGALPEIVEGGKDGLVFARGKSDDLAQKLVTILTDRTLGLALSRAGKERAKDFSIERMAQEHDKLYRRLIYEKEA